MPKIIDDRVRKNAGETYAQTDLTLKEIAKKFKVSDRTVQTWSVEDCWEADRTRHRETNKPQNVVNFARERPTVRAIDKSDDPLEIANTVIADLQADMVRGDIVAKDKAAIANSLKAWVEFRRKLKPPTVADLVELAIEFNVTADQFLDALEDAWTKRA